jgi:hypothetical protein
VGFIPEMPRQLNMQKNNVKHHINRMKDKTIPSPEVRQK